MTQVNAEQSWGKGVEALALRNGPVDLAPAVGDRPDYYRSRLLGLAPNGDMLVERPGVAGISGAMAVGKTVSVTLLVDGRRWQGTATVLASETVALNRAIAVPALRLSQATNIRSGQRRQFYRIALSSIDLRSLTLTLDGATEGTKPLDAHIVNLSAGGLGVRVPTTVRSRDELRQGGALRCRLGLPSVKDDFEIRARLVHVEPLPERLTYLGLRFEFDDAMAERRAQDELVRFVTELERKQLRRSRGG